MPSDNKGLQGTSTALNTRTKAVRGVESAVFKVHNILAGLGANPKPTQTISIPSTLSSHGGSIALDIWRPRGDTASDTDGGSGSSGKRLPCVVAMHGGGFAVGQASDDANFAHAVSEGVPAIVISVGYRLAPEHAFPTAVEDCADAVRHVHAHADALGVDGAKLFTAGFSAGGNLCLASYLLLQAPATWGYAAAPPVPVAGILSFYPMLDNTRSRDFRRDNSVDAKKTLPKAVTNVFDAAYFRTVTDFADARVSPAAASDALLDTLPPIHLVLCELDMLLQEGLDFAERLRMRGKAVQVRVVDGETHGWDKPPPIKPKPSVAEEYTAAMDFMRQTMRGAEISDEHELDAGQERLRGKAAR